MTYHYPVVVIREGKGCWAYVPDLPGVYGRGSSPALASKDLEAALRLYIADCRADGDPIPKSAATIVSVSELSLTA